MRKVTINRKRLQRLATKVSAIIGEINRIELNYSEKLSDPEAEIDLFDAVDLLKEAFELLAKED